jgi:hypothetical protein
MLVNIDNDTALKMLINRLKFWTDDADTIALYEQMYKHYIDGGVFDSIDFDVMQIVDNDFINWCDVISPDDDCYDDIKALYDCEGITDISCEEKNHGYNFIESEYNKYFLVRY